MNYSKEQTEKMIAEYLKKPNMETVEKLAIELGKSKKSIIGKLSREGVYRRSSYKTKTGENPITKLELVAEIAEKICIDPEELSGLEKTPKAVLKKLCKSL